MSLVTIRLVTLALMNGLDPMSLREMTIVQFVALVAKAQGDALPFTTFSLSSSSFVSRRIV